MGGGGWRKKYQHGIKNNNQIGIYTFALSHLNTMPDFRISSNGFKEIKKRLVTRLVAFTFLMAAGGIAFTFFNNKKEQDYTILIPALLIFYIFIFTFSIIRVLKRQKKLLDSYTLTINDNTIARYQLDSPTIILYYNEIKEISKTSNGGFIIKGKASEDIILIPAQIDHYSDLEATLGQIHPITSYKYKTILEKYPFINVFLVIGLMSGVYVSMNKIIVGVCSTLLVGILIWSFFKVQKSKNVQHKAKRAAWWMLIILFSIIYVAILKLTGHPKP